MLYGPKSKYNNYLNLENLNQIKINDKDLEKSIKLYEFQRDRIKTVESKSIVFIGFFGSIVTILGIALKEVILVKNKSITDYYLMVIMSILIIYTSMVIRFAIKALERKGYHSLDEKDILNNQLKEKIVSVINKMKRNYDSINEKVDSMTLAQEFAKRILAFLTVLAIANAIYGIINILFSISNIQEFITNYKLELYFLMLLILCILIAYLFTKKSKKIHMG